MFNTSWRSSLINEKLKKELITTPERCGCITSSPLSQKCKFNHSCTIYFSSTKYLCKPEVKLGCPISIWHIIWILLFTVVIGLFLMTKLGLLPHCRLDQTIMLQLSTAWCRHFGSHLRCLVLFIAPDHPPIHRLHKGHVTSAFRWEVGYSLDKWPPHR